MKVPLPFVFPLHNNGTSGPVSVNANGSVTLMVALAVHPFESVTVTWIEPTPPLLKVKVVAAGVVVPPVVLLSTVKLYGAVPPDAVNVPLALVFPLHNSATSAVLFSTSAAGWVTLIVRVAWQPFASVTVTLIEPTPALLNVKVVAPGVVVPPVVLLFTTKL